MSMHFYITADPDRQLSFKESEKVDKRYRMKRLRSLCVKDAWWSGYEPYLRVDESEKGYHQGPDYHSPVRMWADQEHPDVDYDYLIEFKEEVPMMGVMKDPHKIIEICGFMRKVVSKHNNELPQCYEYRRYQYNRRNSQFERMWIHPQDWTEEAIRSFLFPNLKYDFDHELITYSCFDYYEEFVFGRIIHVCQKAIESNQDVRVYFA